MPQQRCILCSCKLKVHQRRPVNKHLKKYLRRNFFIESTDSDFICGKCSRPAYRQDHADPVLLQLQESEDRVPSSLGSPSNIRLKIQTATKSHGYCFVCKKPGPRLVIVPQQLRTEVFIQHNIIITGQSRCCPCHLDSELRHFNPETFLNLKSMDNTFLNRTAVTDLLDKVRQLAKNTMVKRMSFENIENYTDNDLNNLTGLNKTQFQDLHCVLKGHIRETPARTTSTTTAIFLFKLKSGLSNSLLSTLFGISKSRIRRAIQSVRKLMMEYVVPLNLGFQHVSRESIINNHTRTLAQSLFAETNDQVILVLDGTYIYINKSSNFQFQRRSYSMHKGRPLVKPMVIVSTSGYFVSILGPYFSDTKNNDASILNHILHNNVEEIKNWIKPNDIFVVDRGFRDSLTLLADIGIQSEMPSFLKKGEKQMPTGDANTSRLVTKVRWVVEAGNARIKRWKYLDKILPTTQVPFIGDYGRIVCAISNRYLTPLNSTKYQEEDMAIASRMLDLSKESNTLQEFVTVNNLERRCAAKWADTDISNIQFPALDDSTLLLITLSTYQLKLTGSYIQEYLGSDCTIKVFQEMDGLIRVRLQSRHVSSKSYLVWIRYDSDHIISYYCKCKCGSRTVGTCSHVAAVLWYLGQQNMAQNKYGVKYWGQYLDDAAEIPESVDSSDSEESVVEE